MGDLDRFSALFGEDFGELVDVAEGVGASTQGEATGGALVVVLSVISLDVKLAQVLVVGKTLVDGQPGVVNSEKKKVENNCKGSFINYVTKICSRGI